MASNINSVFPGIPLALSGPRATSSEQYAARSKVCSVSCLVYVLVTVFYSL